MKDLTDLQLEELYNTTYDNLGLLIDEGKTKDYRVISDKLRDIKTEIKRRKV